MCKKVTVRNSQGEWTEREYVPYAGQHFPQEGEDGYIPSQTVPDQSMTLRELLNRYARGQAIPGSYDEGQYHGEDVDGVDFPHLDLAEQEDYILAKSAELEELRRRHGEAVELAKQKRRQKEEELATTKKADGKSEQSEKTADKGGAGH